MEFEDQIVIKVKLDQIGIRPIRVSHFREIWRAKNIERGRRRRRKTRGERKLKKVWSTMGLYGCMDSMDCYGFVWICMDISLFHF